MWHLRLIYLCLIIGFTLGDITSVTIIDQPNLIWKLNFFDVDPGSTWNVGGNYTTTIDSGTSSSVIINSDQNTGVIWLLTESDFLPRTPANTNYGFSIGFGSYLSTASTTSDSGWFGPALTSLTSITYTSDSSIEIVNSASWVSPLASSKSVDALAFEVTYTFAIGNSCTHFPLKSGSTLYGKCLYLPSSSSMVNVTGTLTTLIYSNNVTFGTPVSSSTGSTSSDESKAYKLVVGATILAGTAYLAF